MALNPLHLFIYTCDPGGLFSRLVGLQLYLQDCNSLFRA